MTIFGSRKKRTNTFQIQCDDCVLSGKLTRSGDLRLLINDHEMLTVPGRLIPALAHWLSSVNGRFSDVDVNQLKPTATVVPIREDK